MFDVVCFGSAFIDIYLTSDEFKLKKTQEGVMLCEQYGKKILLKDNLMTTGGGATNAAVCFERLGLQSAVIACVGKDYWASIIRSKLEKEGVSLIHLQSTSQKPTSSSIALVGQDGGRTVLVHRAASNLLTKNKVDWSRLRAKWFYVSSLGGNFALLNKIVNISQEKGIKIAFNPGGSELKQVKKLLKVLPKIDVLILNQQEALTLLNKKSLKSLQKKNILKLEVDLMIITAGRKGARAYVQNGKIIKQKVIKAKTVEETGAGDSFGGSFVAGQIMGLSVEKSLKLAAYNSASVVSAVGPKAGLVFWPDAKKVLKL